MGDPVVRIERRGAALWLTIDRPARRNALNAEVIAGLRQGLREAQADAAVRAVVLTGAGDQAFCAGADLDPLRAFSFDPTRTTTDYADLLREAQACPLPLVARVNGACMAGGIGLVCMADLAVAVDSASFGLPEVKVGVFPMQVMALLQQVVPRRKAREWALLGEPFGAGEALAAGLLNHVVPAAELDGKVEALVRRLAANAPLAVRRGKQAMRVIEALGSEAALFYMEGQIALLAQTEDVREGLAAFAEKRPPRWSGR